MFLLDLVDLAVEVLDLLLVLLDLLLHLLLLVLADEEVLLRLLTLLELLKPVQRGRAHGVAARSNSGS